jgi:predicted ABC-type transport system involved in lysophospholipase L1 biosynthesis ATPase subunit
MTATLLVVTHDPHLAARLDERMRLRDGRLDAEAHAEQLARERASA